MKKTNLCISLVILSFFTISFASKLDEYDDLMRKLKVNFLNLGLKEDSSATPPPIDLVFLVDQSSCMGKTNYIMTMRFLKKILDFFSVSPGTTRVGLITYSDIARKIFNFTQYANRKAVQKTLLKHSKLYDGKESTHLGKGLSAAVDYFNDFTRPKTQRILIAVTNGGHGSDADFAQIGSTVAALDKLSVKRYVFTIGQSLQATNIKLITSKPTTKIGPQQYHFIFKSIEAIRWVCNLLPEAYYVYCNKPGIWRDECHRKCECVNGHIINCQRERQEILSMSVKERTLFINTYRSLTSVEPYKTRYNNFIAIHSRYFFEEIHESLQFLPWHRWFLLAMENLLLSVDCRVTYPYWDWSLVSGDPWNPNLLFSNRPDGLGTRSSFEQDPDGCVLDGPFGKNSGWRTQAGNCLQRDFFSGVPDLPIVMDVLTERNFPSFENALRVNLHDFVHCSLGGTMCSLDSATAPEFFMHHGYIDKLWFQKQGQSAAHKQGIFVGSKIDLAGSGGLTAAMFLDNEALPGYVNVTYADPVTMNAQIAMKMMKVYSVTELLNMRRKGNFTLFSKTAAENFKISSYDKEMAMQYAAKNMKILAAHKLTETLTGEAKLLGIKIPPELEVV